MTNLMNYAMPLLRYKIGDRGVLADNRQLGGQILKTVVGRSVDTFKAADGTLIDGEYFTHLLYFRPWVQKCQIVQTNLSEVVVRVVLSQRGEPPAQDTVNIADNIRLVLGSKTTVSFEYPGEIEPSPSGKFRYTISEVR